MHSLYIYTLLGLCPPFWNPGGELPLSALPQHADALDDFCSLSLIPLKSTRKHEEEIRSQASIPLAVGWLVYRLRRASERATNPFRSV